MPSRVRTFFSSVMAVAALPALDEQEAAQSTARETLVTACAATLAILTVAFIALLMGMG